MKQLTASPSANQGGGLAATSMPPMLTCIMEKEGIEAAEVPEERAAGTEWVGLDFRREKTEEEQDCVYVYATFLPASQNIQDLIFRWIIGQ